nr:hypothetical protein [Tanacetum cinerariifolium]
MCDMVGQYIQKKEEEKQIEEEQVAKTRYWKIPACYDDDDDDYTIAITYKEPDNSLSMRDEHLDTILAKKSNESIKSSVENLVPNPSESKGEHECDVPVCDDFTTFSNLLFDANDDFSSNHDESFSYEDILKKIYSNPLFDEEIISMKIDPHYFNADNPFMEEIDLFLASDGSIPSGIDSAYSDSDEDYLFLERLLHDDPIPLSDTLDFSNVVRVFLPFFTYPVTSSILLSSGKCSSCGALYTMDYYCSEVILRDKIICDLDKTPNLSERSPQNCPKCGHLVDGHYCQGCALLRKKFKEDLFTYCIENGILQDSSEPSNENSKIANAPREPFVVNQDPEPFNNQTIKELPPTVQSFDPKSDLVHDSLNVFDPPPQPPFYSCEFCGNDAR